MTLGLALASWITMGVAGLFLTLDGGGEAGWVIDYATGVG